MAKLWTYFKNIMVVWGIIWLAIVLWIVATITAKSFFSTSDLDNIKEDSDEVYKEKLADLELNIKRSSKESGPLLLNLNQGNKTLVKEYPLPSEGHDISYTSIKNATGKQIAKGKYRFILQGGSYDCDQESYRYIWVLNYDGSMQLSKFLVLTDTKKIAASKDRIFANKVINLPKIKDEQYDQVLIPVEITLNDDVTTKTMLGRQNRQLVLAHYSKLINERISKLEKSDDGKLADQYKTALQQLEADLRD